MSANINMESFDTLVMSIIAENQVIIKRKELGLFTQKLIELDSDIQEIEKQNQEKSDQISSFWKSQLESQTNFSLDQYHQWLLQQEKHCFTYLIIDLNRQTTVASLIHYFNKWGRVMNTKICHYGSKNLLCGFISFPNQVIDLPLEHNIDDSPVVLILDPKPQQFAAIFGKMSTLSDLILKRHFSKFGEIDFVHKSETKINHDTSVAFIKFKSADALTLITSTFHNIRGKNLIAYEII